LTIGGGEAGVGRKSRKIGFEGSYEKCGRENSTGTQGALLLKKKKKLRRGNNRRIKDLYCLLCKQIPKKSTLYREFRCAEIRLQIVNWGRSDA